jgi:hypothetical protein
MCPDTCSGLPKAFDYPGIVKFIGDLWPGNQVIDNWLAAYNSGTANVPTPEQVDLAIKLKTSQFWSFGNPSLPADWMKGFNFTSLAPAFHAFWTALGFQPPPLNTEQVDPSLEPGTGTPPAGGNNSVLSLTSFSEQKTTKDPAVEQTPTTSDEQKLTAQTDGTQLDGQTVTTAGTTGTGGTPTVQEQAPSGTDQPPAADANAGTAAPAGSGNAGQSASDPNGTGLERGNKPPSRTGDKPPSRTGDDGAGHGVLPGSGGKGAVGTGQGSGKPAAGNAGDIKSGDADSGGGKAGDQNAGKVDDSNTAHSSDKGTTGDGGAGGRHRAA